MRGADARSLVGLAKAVEYLDGFGGNLRAAASVVCEIAFSTVLAPVMLLLQTRAVAQVLLGLDGGWPATKRGQNWISLDVAFRASWWIMAMGLEAACVG